MDNELIKLGKSFGKDAKESQVNTGRIQANLPQIERKLDIVSNGYNFSMDIPLSDVTSIASLDIRIRPDNCCDCDTNGSNATRKSTADVTRWEDINGTEFLPGQPVDNPQNGVEYRGIITSMTTVGVLDSIWFAWPGYPFFYPNSYYKDDFETNSYGDFALTNGSIVIPATALYNLTYHGHASGWTTATSKITVMIKRKSLETGLWETVSREIRSVSKGNLQANSMMIALDLTISAICYGFLVGDEVAIWVVAEDIESLSYSSGTMKMVLVGLGYGAISGYVYDDGTMDYPLEGASVRILLPTMTAEYTDERGFYYITNIQPGVHTVEAIYGIAPNIHTAYQTVTVLPLDIVEQVNFIL
jgi:hypothetical protein